MTATDPLRPVIAYPTQQALTDIVIDTRDFYAQLFSAIESRYGKLDDETVTAVIGFTAGGPVSISKISDKDFFVTCELALNPNQVMSSEGLRFELASHGTFNLDQSREVLTALGDLSLRYWP